MECWLFKDPGSCTIFIHVLLLYIIYFGVSIVSDVTHQVELPSVLFDLFSWHLLTSWPNKVVQLTLVLSLRPGISPPKPWLLFFKNGI